MIWIKVQDVIGVKRALKEVLKEALKEVLKEALKEALKEVLKEALKDHVMAVLGVVIVPVLLKDVIMMAHSMLRANLKTKKRSYQNLHYRYSLG